MDEKTGAGQSMLQSLRRSQWLVERILSAGEGERKPELQKVGR